MLRLRPTLTTAMLCTVIFGLAVSFTPLSAQGKGKGKPGGGGGGSDPPTLPPVRYHVKTFRMPDASAENAEAQQMTSSGIVVGYYITNGNLRHPFIYDPSVDPDVAINLNDLDISWHEPGWRLVVALDVNELGYVVGYMEEVSNPGIRHGYALDLNSNPAFLVPLSTGSAPNYARRINDNMDIVGVSEAAGGGNHVYLYNLADDEFTDVGLLAAPGVELSNPPLGQPAQIVGQYWDSWTVFRYTAGHGIDTSVSPFLGTPHGIAPNGDFCGTFEQYNKGGKNVTYRPFRYRGSLQVFSDLQGYAHGINTHGDFVTWNSQQLYHQGTGFLDLNSLIVGDPTDAAIWGSSWVKLLPDITERGTLNPEMPNFPGICAKLANTQYGPRGAVLIPVAP